MNHPLPRFHRHTQAAHDAARLAAILLETGEPAPPNLIRTGTHLAVDAIRLRGIPAIGRGVSGAVPGSVPHALR